METILQDGSEHASAVRPALGSPGVGSESYWQPSRVVVSAWLEHAPFAAWVMKATAPEIFVELGTHNGFSFFTFCEAAMRLGLPTRSFAIDSWEGDIHAGFYGDEIFNDVSAVAVGYAERAVLLRGYFDDFVNQFDDGSIDLLHIDGRHEYEDARHDFESWLPKVSNRGVVLFHDTAEHERGFGVWKLWDEVAAKYPSFGFEHGHGLGVLAVGKEVPDEIRPLFELGADEAEQIRSFYSGLGLTVLERYSGQVQFAAIEAEIENLRTAQILLLERAERVESSLSWRITAPLRSALGFFRRILRRKE